MCCNEQQEYILEKAQGLMEIVAHAKGLLPPSHEHAAFFDQVHMFCQESSVYIPTASAIHLIVCDQASGKDKSLLAAEAADIIEFFHEMGYWCRAESDSAQTKPIIHEYFKAQLLEMAVKSDAFKEPEDHACFSSLHRTLGVDTWCDTDAITLLCQSSVAVAS